MLRQCSLPSSFRIDHMPDIERFFNLCGGFVQFIVGLKGVGSGQDARITPKRPATTGVAMGVPFNDL